VNTARVDPSRVAAIDGSKFKAVNARDKNFRASIAPRLPRR
jgi:hypothetical protein